MTHTDEEFVRRELRSILAGDTYRNRFVCLLDHLIRTLYTRTVPPIVGGW